MPEGSSVNDVRAILSRNLESINDMVVLPKESFSQCRAVGFADLKDRTVGQERTKWAGANRSMRNFTKGLQESILDPVNAYATRVVTDNKAYSEAPLMERYKVKKDLVVKVLSDPQAFVNDPVIGEKIKNFLSVGFSDKNINVTIEDKLSMLGTLAEHIDNTSENDRYECKINYTKKVADIAKETAAVLDFGKDKGEELDLD